MWLIAAINCLVNCLLSYVFGWLEGSVKSQLANLAHFISLHICFTSANKKIPVLLLYVIVLLLISILPKNQAATIEIVISDFFRILKTFIAFDSLCHKSPKAKGKL